jgi:hypothetical protein
MSLPEDRRGYCPMSMLSSAWSLLRGLSTVNTGWLSDRYSVSAQLSPRVRGGYISSRGLTRCPGPSSWLFKLRSACHLRADPEL